MSGGAKRDDSIYNGCTMSEMRFILGKRYEEILKACEHLNPIGNRGASPLYSVREVAQKLFRTVGDDDEETFKRIMGLRVDDLPPKLRENYWKTARVRQTYEREKGDLWPTDQIIELATEALKTLRLSMLLIPDTMAREATLSEKQRAIVQRVIDNALDQARRKLVDAFDSRRTREVSEPTGSPEEGGDEEEDL